MKQGRKSRTVLAIGCALVALVAVALVAPGFAGAQAAGDEYNRSRFPARDTAATTCRQPGLPAPGSDQGGGGAPVLIIALAIVAAVCTGVAAWRLRGGPKDDVGAARRRDRSHQRVAVACPAPIESSPGRATDSVASRSQSCALAVSLALAAAPASAKKLEWGIVPQDGALPAGRTWT